MILYLKGKLAGAKSLKAWAVKRAQWLKADQMRKEFGRPRQDRKWRSEARYFVSVDDPRFRTHPLRCAEPSALLRAEQRQEIERANHLTRRELADVI